MSATLQNLLDALELIEELTVDLSVRTRDLSEMPTSVERRMEGLIRRMGEVVMLSREMELILTDEIECRTGTAEPELS